MNERGVATVETVVVSSFAMLCIFAPMQLALLGFGQLQSDGSAYVSAHLNAVNALPNANAAVTSRTPEQIAAQIFPHASAPSTTVVPSPTLTTPPIDMGWNQPPVNGTVPLNTDFQTGFFLFTSAATVESSATSAGTVHLPFFGDVTSTTLGTAREAAPYWYTTDEITGADVKAGLTQFGVPYGVLLGSPDGLTVGMTVAPEVVLRSKHWYCSNDPGTPCTNNASTDYAEGPYPNAVVPHPIGMGEAAHLKDAMWNAQSNGVTPMNKAVFWEAAYHLQVFQEFATMGDQSGKNTFSPLPAVWYPSVSPLANGLGDHLDPKTNLFLRTMTSWDGFTDGCVTSDISYGYSFYTDGSAAPRKNAAPCSY